MLALQNGRHASHHFTLSGSSALEAHLSHVCRQVRAGCEAIVPADRLEGIALGGGYGRGEGGVLKTPSGDLPYNDLEFYVFVSGKTQVNDLRYRRNLRKLAESLEPEAGVELEFKITSLEKLRRSTPNLFFHDLVTGHRWIRGDESLFAGCEHHRDASQLPLSEATRLLMNRCSGLLFAKEKLERNLFTSHDADFVCRNYAKTELALGDALLIAHGQYHWSSLLRSQRLNAFSPAEDLPWLPEVKQRHSAGVEFKLRPEKSLLSRELLQQSFQSVSARALKVWLWLESHRLASPFNSADDYALSRLDKWPGQSPRQNWLSGLKVFGARALFGFRKNIHPRHHILTALTLLLWARREGASNLDKKIRHELMVSNRLSLIDAYRLRWSQAS